METKMIEESDTAGEGSELLPDAPPKPADTPIVRKRGFAAMAPDLVRAISRKGGIAAHATGSAHEFTSEEARVAGRKGGHASHAKRAERPQNNS
jgi:uncharacterized protein